jgi:hypothetical protein
MMIPSNLEDNPATSNDTIDSSSKEDHGTTDDDGIESSIDDLRAATTVITRSSYTVTNVTSTSNRAEKNSSTDDATTNYSTDEEDGGTSSHGDVANISDVKVTINVMGMGSGMVASSTSADHRVSIIKDDEITSQTTQKIENTSDDSRL